METTTTQDAFMAARGWERSKTIVVRSWDGYVFDETELDGYSRCQNGQWAAVGTDHRGRAYTVVYNEDHGDVLSAAASMRDAVERTVRLDWYAAARKANPGQSSYDHSGKVG